jgi:hypothetical protein
VPKIDTAGYFLLGCALKLGWMVMMRFSLLLGLIFIFSGCGKTPSQHAIGETPTTSPVADPSASLAILSTGADAAAVAIRAKYFRKEDFSSELASLDPMNSQLAEIKASLTSSKMGELQDALNHTETRIKLGTLEGYGFRVANLFFELSDRIRTMAKPPPGIPKIFQEVNKASSGEDTFYLDTLKTSHELVDRIESLVKQKQLAGKLYLPKNLVPNDFGISDKTAGYLVRNPELGMLFVVKAAIETLGTERIRSTQLFVKKQDKKKAGESRELLLNRITEIVEKLKVLKPVDEIKRLEDLL